MPPDALFYSFSGQRYTARSALYKKVKLLLPGMFPDKTFEFLGNPFGDTLPCPLLWSDEVHDLQASSRVIDLWKPLNEASIKAKAALARGSVVFTDGLGLDVMLYAAAMVECHLQNDEAFRMHSGFVGLRLKEQGIPTPIYFITRADVDVVDKLMLKKHPRLKNIAEHVRRAFIMYEERMCTRDYFEKVSNQKTPNYIDASLSIDEMAQQVITVVGKHLASRNSVAA